MFSDAVSEYKQFFGENFKDHATQVQAVDLVRQRIAGVTDKMSLPRLVSQAYASPPDGLIPAATQALLSNGKKFWQDEFRFVVCGKTKALYAAARSSPSSYSVDAWAALVRTFRFERPGNDYAKEAGMLSMVTMKTNVAPTADFYELMKFVNSTDFLYTPAPEGMIGGYMGDVEDPTDMAVYNRNYDAMRTMGRTRTRRNTGVSPLAMSELRMYAAKNGGSLAGLGI
jgi:hypothetical protein